MRSQVPSWLQVVACVTCVLFLQSADLALNVDPDSSGSSATGRHIQIVVDRLRGALGIQEAVSVSVLPEVALVMSVEAPGDSGRAFRLAIDDRFLARLTPDELDAAIAHELGHVWVFTHHPYLQTERLANQIALRVVLRQSLASVYHKLWEHGGTKGDLETFLGP